MFTEQPAPPQPVAEVQTHQSHVAVSQATSQSPTLSRIVAPEALPSPAAALTPSSSTAEAPSLVPGSPAKTATPAPVPAATPISEGHHSTSAAHEAAKAQRRKEVEQALIEITAKSRAQQKEREEQKAAMDAAKYAEADEFDAAKKVVNNPTLTAKARANLLKKLQAKQAKKNLLAGKKATPNSKNAQAQASSGKSTGAIAAPEYLGNSGTGYISAPIVPITQAELRLRLGKLVGRNLDFAFPLSIPAPITSMFGWRIHPISGNPRFHRGIDFGAPLGTPIVAAKAGRVEVADFMDGYGLTVLLRHPKAQQTLYGHLSQVFVKPGDVVKKGQLLGLVGSTGNSTGPHLHFEVHEMTSEGWVALDPALVLNPAIALAQVPQIPASPSRKPQTFNLSLSGLLDINTPTQPFSVIPPVGETLLSGLLPLSRPQDNFVPGMLLPIALFPSAIPEVRWLISPFVDNWLADELLIPLPDLRPPVQTITFNAFPVLEQISESVAFDPTAFVPPTPTAVRLANSKPFNGLTIAEQTPGAVRLEALQKSPAVSSLQANRNLGR